MADEIAIKVDHLSKTFKLPHEKQTSIKGALISRFKGRKRSYEKQEVLQDISFDIKKGEFFGIVGRNGSGKSTLLKLLAGIYSPTKGGINVNGSLTPFIELGVGFNQELTGRENIFLNGALLGFGRSQMSKMYNDIVDFAELEQFMDQKLKNYSSGMQVRLAFSIAIRARSDILLLDEVLAVGDSAFQLKCVNYFNQLKKANKTVVFVSHDMSSVKRFCDRVLVINAGKVDGLFDAEQGVQRYEDLNLQGELKGNRNLMSEVVETTGKGYKKVGGLIENIVISGSSRPGNIVKFGDTISCEVSLKNSKLVDGLGASNTNCHCSVGVFNDQGVMIVNTLSEVLRLTENTKSIEVVLDMGRLSPGMYSLYFGIYEVTQTDDICIDVTDQPSVFGVESGKEKVSEGLMQIPVKWKFKKEN